MEVPPQDENIREQNDRVRAPLIEQSPELIQVRKPSQKGSKYLATLEERNNTADRYLLSFKRKHLEILKRNIKLKTDATREGLDKLSENLDIMAKALHKLNIDAMMKGLEKMSENLNILAASEDADIVALCFLFERLSVGP